MSNLERVTQRFEIAVTNFARSAFDLFANEKAFQAWYAASVIHEFGISRVYREIHLMKSQLDKLVGPLPELEKGNELFPDLSVSWDEGIDARHTVARPPELNAGGMLSQLAVISELKVTGSTGKPTSPRAIRIDLTKLGVFAAAVDQVAVSTGVFSRGLAPYLVVLDNHRLPGGRPSGRFGPDRFARLLSLVAESWPAVWPPPVVLVAGFDSGVEVHRYEGFRAAGKV
jgi:hypothetical protein